MGDFLKISDRGQLTIPKDIRESCGLTAGREVRLLPMPDGTVMIIPLQDGIGHIGRRNRYRGPPLTIEEMDAAKERAVAEHVLGRTPDND